MKRSAVVTILVLLAAGSALAQNRSSYSGMETRQIKALSDNQVRDYLAGSGMGLALPAELNRYPGPKHVLEMADDLSLSEKQKYEAKMVFEKMQRDAKRIGKAIVDWESNLDGLFSAGKVTDDQLGSTLDGLAELAARLRYTHLIAHVKMHEILTEEQVDRYVVLRGYDSQSPRHKSRKHHSMEH